MILLDDRHQIDLEVFFDCIESNTKNFLNYLKCENNNFTKKDFEIFLLDLQVNIREGKEIISYNSDNREER